jgi:cell division protein ZapA
MIRAVMNENDTFLINVQIGGYRLPLRIERKEEELYRLAEKVLGKYLEAYQKKYSHRSAEEVFIFVAYELAVMLVRKMMQQNTAPLAEKVSSLNQELEKLLAEK